ncbi:MAG: LPP20 family lipoprotein [Planctomycetota bacterium]
MRLSIFLVIACAILGACAIRSPDTAHASTKSVGRIPWQSDKPLPSWIGDPTDQGKRIAAYGSADRNFGEGRSTQHERAMSNARQELARMISVRIQGVVKDYIAESSAGSTAYLEQVSRQIANSSVSGSYQIAEWSNEKTDEMFVLVLLDPVMAKRMGSALSEAIRSGSSGDPTLDAHLKAKAGSNQAQSELDRLLENRLSTQQH